jgi:hypothetical protein
MTLADVNHSVFSALRLVQRVQSLLRIGDDQPFLFRCPLGFFPLILPRPHAAIGMQPSTTVERAPLGMVGQIRKPTLIVAAQDDPLSPSCPFETRRCEQPIHYARYARTRRPLRFVSRNRGNERFWAGARVVEFCLEHSEIAKGRGTLCAIGVRLKVRSPRESDVCEHACTATCRALDG